MATTLRIGAIQAVVSNDRIDVTCGERLVEFAMLDRAVIEGFPVWSVGIAQLCSLGI